MLSRRQLLQWCGLSAAAITARTTFGEATPIASTPLIIPPTPVSISTTKAKRSIRLAHLTDVHVEPELDAGLGFETCLHHVQALADKPELILFGGDMVMETMHHDAPRAKTLWDLWHSIVKSENSIPFQPCIGNHDVWGWNKKASKTTGNEANWGKQRALDEYGLAKPYRSWDQAGWHFIVLDSIFPFESTYCARLDDTQYDWLADDLAKTNPKTPVLVMSHIPIFSITCEMKREFTKMPDDIDLGRGSTHLDQVKIKNLFKKHQNVKLCISGHVHLADRVDYLGVTYLCNGAVSGDWWKGYTNGDECPEGYAVLDLYEDGTFDHSYQTYGWRTRAGKGTKSDDA